MKNVPYLDASAKLHFSSESSMWANFVPYNKLGSFRIHIIVGMLKTRY